MKQLNKAIGLAAKKKKEDCPGGEWAKRHPMYSVQYHLYEGCLFLVFMSAHLLFDGGWLAGSLTMASIFVVLNIPKKEECVLVACQLLE